MSSTVFPIANRFFDGEFLGQGGMGEVYRARDHRLRRDVAIKVTNWSGPDEHDDVTREARAMARVNHPNVAQIYDIVQHQGKLYLIQEYVHGVDLGLVFFEHRKRRAWDWREVLSVCMKLARGLEAVHQEGLMHRDIKPGNIMLAGYVGERGPLNHGFIDPKLIDFGVAQIQKGHEDGVASTDVATPKGAAGTPRYVAPEIWLDPAAVTPKADVFSLGVVMYLLCTGHVPHPDVRDSRLRRVVPDQEIKLSADDVADIHPRFVAIVNRCLAMSPGRRFDARALRQELESLHDATASRIALADSPFRGLQAFQSNHRQLFFGRNDDIARIIGRMKHSHVVCVQGLSGVGKSSLVRAGVLPVIEEHGLRDGRSWQTTIATPGKQPLHSLASALHSPLAMARDELVRKMRSEPTWLIEHAARHLDSTTGLVIFVDQLEELVTLARDDRDRACAVRTLVDLAEQVGGIRVVATLRGDKIAELAQLSRLGEHIVRPNQWLFPIETQNVCSIIEAPVHAMGYRFESADTVDELVRFMEEAPSGLPLLQFALAEMWNKRDRRRQVIPEDTLDKIGGVHGALAKHANRVMQTLPPPATFEAAKKVLIQLTANRTRTHCSYEDLALDSDVRRKAIDFLLQERLLMTREDDGEYEIAHEALITGWKNLQGWIAERGGLQLLEEQVRQAARRWQEHGRRSKFLLTEGPLQEAEILEPDELEPSLAGEFLRLSRRRARIKKRVVRSIALGLVVAIAAGYAWVRYRDRLHAEQREKVKQESIDKELGSITTTLEELVLEDRGRLSRLESDRAAALQAFQSIGQSTVRSGSDEELAALAGAEERWQAFLEGARYAEQELVETSRALRYLLQRDSGRSDVKDALLRALHAQALLTYRLGHDVLHRETVAELERYDSRRGGALWTRDIQVSLNVEPDSIPAALCRYQNLSAAAVCQPIEGARHEDGSWHLAPGSYSFVFQADGKRPNIHFPFLLEAGPVNGSEVTFELSLPDSVPDGFEFVHRGTFLFGYGRDAMDESLRIAYDTLPLHPRRTRSFIVARHETTFADWLEFLRDQPAEALEELVPNAPERIGLAAVQMQYDTVNPELVRLYYKPAPGEGRWYTLEQSVHYPERDRARSVDWQLMPVTGVSAIAAVAYADWLGQKRVPGARLCHEDEWERAARGADDRMYPLGAKLGVEDANFDKTYGRLSGAYGLDEVGSHKGSRSPFGIHDMAGNGWEFTRAIYGRLPMVNRGGSYYQAQVLAASPLRDVAPKTHKDAKMGFRICADWPPDERGSTR